MNANEKQQGLFQHVSRKVWLVLAAVAAVGLLGLLAQSPSAGNTAWAETQSDLFGTQRSEILAAARETNAKLDQLIDLLKSGQVKIQVVEDTRKKSGENDVPTSRSK